MTNKLVKLSMFLAVFAIATVTCKKDRQPEIKVENQTALTQTAYADQTSGASSVTVTTSGAWTSSVTEGTVKSVKAGADTWLSIAPDHGDAAGKYTISISMSPNITGADRTATVTISCNEEVIHITVTQAATRQNGEPYLQSPVLVIDTLRNITVAGAIADVVIIEAGTPAYTERGVCYAVTANPTVAVETLKVPVAGTGKGSFSANLTGLSAETKYYVRAYATSEKGTFYSNEKSFTTDAAAGGKSVTVGAQVGTLMAGTAGTVSFPVNTANIADGDYDVTVSILPTGVVVQGKVTINNNGGTLTLAGDASTAAGVTSTLTLTIDGVTSPAFTLTISEAAGEKTVLVGAQVGTLTAGNPGTVTFPVTTENIADGDYDVMVNNRPGGVTVQGKVTISNNGGTLTLAGSASTAPVSAPNLMLTIDGVTSPAFTLTVLPPKSAEVSQGGSIRAGVEQTVPFNVYTAGIANGAYPVTVANLPVGVTVQGDVTISNNYGILTLAGSAATVVGVTSNLTLTIDGVTSPAFSLNITPFKTVNITGGQSETLITGTAGTATFPVRTENIANGQTGTVTWYSDQSGMTAISAPDGLSASVSPVESNAATVTVNATATAVDGNYFFRVTIDGTLSSGVGLLFVSGAGYQSQFVKDGIYYKAMDPGSTEVKVTNKLYSEDPNALASFANSYSGAVDVSATVEYEGVTYTVIWIGYGAFYGSASLTSVTLSEGVRVIEPYAFADCPSLATLHLPASLTSLATYVFGGCANLTLTAAAGGPFNVADGVLFRSNSSNAQYYLQWIPEKRTGEYVIPDGVFQIYSFAIINSRLSKITIPASVNSLNGQNFNGCTSLTDITFLRPNPPTTDLPNFYFTDVNKANITLHVPAVAENVYAAHQLWGNGFKAIVTTGGNDETYTVTTLAGTGQYGFANGPGYAAQFYNPCGVAVDASGNIYVADVMNYRIRKITPEGVVTTFAGNGEWGFADGSAGSAKFYNPVGVAVDASGNVYVADSDNHRIRKITPEGEVTTLAGSATRGFADGPGTEAQFYTPYGVAVDASGNVYVADRMNQRIRKITPAGVVSTLAGAGTTGYKDGAGSEALFNNPYNVAVDASGNVYVADYNNQRIRKITTAGVVSTFAGAGATGYLDGAGSAALFNSPYAVTLDASGNVYVADLNNHRIRKITPAGVVSTIAGAGAQGYKDGAGSEALFNSPAGIAIDASGNIYVAERNNHRIRKIVKN